MRLLVFASVLPLAACMPQAPQQQHNQQQASGAVTSKPAAHGAATATPVASQSGKPDAEAPVETTPILDRDFLVGRWGDNGDCTKDVTLNADGSFTSYSGGEGQWSLNGTTMRMAGKQSTQELQLELIDQNTLRITNPDGSVGTSQRCE